MPPGDAIRTCVVSSVEEYRAYADECFGWAKTARTERERQIFLEMAQTWLQAATVHGLQNRDPSKTAKIRSDGGPNSSADP